MSRNYNPRRAGAPKQAQDDKQMTVINSLDEIPKNMSDEETAEFWSTHSMSEELLENQIIEEDLPLPPVEERIHKQVVPSDIVWQPGDYPSREVDEIAPYKPQKQTSIIREQHEQDEKEKSQKAVYNVQRTANGVSLTHVDKKEEQYVNIKNKKLNTLKEMIVNTEKEITKIELEIEIHTVLEKESKSEQEHNMNLRRLESFRTNYEYLQKKLNVALGMIK